MNRQNQDNKLVDRIKLNDFNKCKNNIIKDTYI